MAGENPGGYSFIDSGKVLNKEGLLELCNQIKTEIANNSGGGSSYTAGDGINIDSNNAINSDIATFFQKNSSNQIIGVVSQDYPPKNTGTGGINIGLNVNKQGARGTYSFLIGQDNESSNKSMWGYVIGNGNTFDGRNSVIIGGLNRITEDKYSNHSTVVIGRGNESTSGGSGSIVAGSGLSAQSSFQTVLGTYNIPDANDQFSIIIGNSPNQNSNLKKNALAITRDNAHTYWATDLYVNCSDFTTTSTGLTTANCGGNKVATESYVDTRIPPAPTTDGTYMLKCVVSSGTPTYSWVSV